MVRNFHLHPLVFPDLKRGEVRRKKQHKKKGNEQKNSLITLLIVLFETTHSKSTLNLFTSQLRIYTILNKEDFLFKIPLK